MLEERISQAMAWNAACEGVDAAAEVFEMTRQSYRAGLADEDSLLAARALYHQAKAEYGQAFVDVFGFKGNTTNAN